MGTNMMRVSDETKETLERRKRPGESFDDVIQRLMKETSDKWEGFGALADTPIGDGVEQVHEEMCEEMEEDIEEQARD